MGLGAASPAASNHNDLQEAQRELEVRITLIKHCLPGRITLSLLSMLHHRDDHYHNYCSSSVLLIVLEMIKWS